MKSRSYIEIAAIIHCTHHKLRFDIKQFDHYQFVILVLNNYIYTEVVKQLFLVFVW